MGAAVNYTFTLSSAAVTLNELFHINSSLIVKPSTCSSSLMFTCMLTIRLTTTLDCAHGS